MTVEVLTSEEMRAADQAAIGTWQMDAELLMESAGALVARAAEWALAGGLATPRRPAVALESLWPARSDEVPGIRWPEERVRRGRATGRDHVVVVAGHGANGGDGMVAARYLAQLGWPVDLLLVGKAPVGITGRQWERLRRLGLVAGEGVPVGTAAADVGLLRGAALIIDAITGTGARPGLSDRFAETARAIAAERARGSIVLAVDLPSGLDGDATGESALLDPVAGQVVSADLTVVVSRPKVGELLYPGARDVGRLLLAPIPIPGEAIAQVGARCWLETPAEAATWLAERSADAHKGRFGHVLVIGGSRGLSGAPGLAARGALQSGAGLVSVLTHQEVASAVAAGVPEAMVLGLPVAGPTLDAGILDDPLVVERLGRASVLLLGPGLGVGPGSAALVRRLISRWQGPLVLDADALNVLDSPSVAAAASHDVVLTPHPGEAARLLGVEPGRVAAAPLSWARRLAGQTGALTVLKGARTVITAPGGESWINPTATARLATGGTGDVLGGLIASLLAQGLPAGPAARVGALLHGLAAELAPDLPAQGPGLTASRLAAGLSSAFTFLGRAAGDDQEDERGRRARSGACHPLEGGEL